MKKTLPALLFASLIFNFIPSAHAGSPGGLHIIVTSTANAKPYIDQLGSFFERYDKGRSLQECQNRQLNIEAATFNGRQNSFPAEEILAIQGSKERKRLAKRLSAYRDQDHTEGLDGLLTVDFSDDSLMLRGIPTSMNRSIQTERVRVSDLKESSILDLAVCKVLVNFLIMRAP